MKDKMLILKGNEKVVKELSEALQNAGFELYNTSTLNPVNGYGMVTMSPELITQIIVAVIGSGGLVASVLSAFKKKMHIKITKGQNTVEIDVTNIGLEQTKELLEEIDNFL